MRLTLAFLLLACACACDEKKAAPTVVSVDAGPVEPVGTAVAKADGPKLIPVTANGIGPMGAGLVNRALLTTVFLKDQPAGTIEETSDVTDGELVGRAFTVKRGEGVDAHVVAIVHADTDGRLYTVEIVSPIAEVRGVKVGDFLGKALGDEPVKCARGIEDKEELVYCARAKEPSIMFTTKPPHAGQVAPDILRALPITAIVWSPHAKW